MKKFILIIVCAISINISSAQDYTVLRNYMSAAEKAVEDKKSNDAIEYLKKAASTAPDNFVPLYKLGQVYNSLNNIPTAAQYYTRSLSLISANTLSQKIYECYGTTDDVSYRKIMTSIYDVLAVYNKNAGQISLAKRYNNLNIRLNIDYGYKAPVVSSLERIYSCYADEGKWNECFEYFTEIRMVIPHGGAWGMCEAVWHAVMGDCYAHFGKEREMINEYQQAARLGHINAINYLKNAGIAY